MKYRTIIQVNQADRDLTLNIVEEDAHVQNVIQQESNHCVKPPVPMQRLSNLLRRTHSRKYDLAKSERRKSSSDSDLVESIRIVPLDQQQKNADSWVVVRKLQTEADGGILDPDDRLVEVADDREQILAIFEEEHEGIPNLQHIPGDGTSTSSVGTSSPDIFTGGESNLRGFGGRTDIQITNEELSGRTGGSPGGTGVTLQVRRGSEPALNRLSPIPVPLDTSSRWSAAPIVNQPNPPLSVQKLSTPDDVRNVSEGSVNSSSTNSVILNYGNHKGPPSGNVTVVTTPTVTTTRREPLSNQNLNSAIPESHPGYVGHQVSAINDQHRFATTQQHTFLPVPTGVAQSQPSPAYQVQMRQHEAPGTANSGHPLSRFYRDSNRHSMQFAMGSKWTDAADSALFLSIRKDPLGAATSPVSSRMSPPPYASTPLYRQAERDVDTSVSSAEEEITEVILKFEEGPLGIHLIPEHRGLIIQGVEPGGRIDRDGRLEAGDKIIEINGHSLLGMSFPEAQELFRKGLKLQELLLKIIKNPRTHSEFNHAQSAKFSSDAEEKENMIQGREIVGGESKVAAVRRKSLPGPVQSLPLMRQSTSSLISANTRKIGRKYEIELKKGSAGLGFSITTRDNPAGGNCPIYIKNVLPTGAAIDDGRLRPGDRLLEVNGIEITGKSQSEAVSILRNVPQEGMVKLLVSRQERVDLSPKLPRQIPPEKVGEDDAPAVPWSEREVFVLDIPVMDTEKAGLGISVKGNAQKGLVDNGIYIKSVIHGGAASRDGRLKPNDQLLSVNDVSLLNRSNVDAMETLRRTLTQDGPKPKPGFITLQIARRIATSSAPTTDISAYGSSGSGDELDSWGCKNVSFSADGGGQSGLNNQNPSIMTLNQQDNLNNSHIPVNPRDTHVVIPSVPNVLDIGQHRRSSTPGDNMATMKWQHHLTKPEDVPDYHQRLIHPVSTSILPPNPVVERLTGKNTGGAVRSESYYRATNESRNARGHQSTNFQYQPFPESQGIQNHQNQVLLETEYSTPSKPPRFSGPTITNEQDAWMRLERLEGDGSRACVPDSPQSHVAASSVAYASQTSLEEDSAGFARDAFGRQSMSEKRHTALDAKGTDTYQRTKRLRDERERQRKVSGRKLDTSQRVGSVESLVETLRTHRSPEKKRGENHAERRVKNDIGRSLGMKKSSSLESLQTMVQEIQIQEDVKSGIGPLRSGPAPVKVIRGRGCNESFRQAVDRSYEAALGDYDNDMETLQEEENESSLPGAGASDRFSYHQPSEHSEDIYGKTKVGGKKKPGIFRGLGSMFRFGRHRKSIHGPLTANELRKQQAETEKLEKEYLEQSNKEDRAKAKARQAAQNENMRIQEQYRRLVDRNRAEAAQQSPYGITVSIGRKSPGYGTLSSPRNSLRPNHPLRKSMDSHSRQASRSLERELAIASDVNGNENLVSPSHLRSASYDFYNEFTRPGSRLGIVDPKKYSHYINYDEIRLHLNRRHQQHYHSQRREHPKESRQERPVSNFYEYESVQKALQEANQNQKSSHQHQPIYVVQNQNGNNGVTLPSPTSIPFHPSVSRLSQPSASQFQVPQQQQFYGPRNPQSANFNNLRQQSYFNFQKQNSLPRHSHPHQGPPHLRPHSQASVHSSMQQDHRQLGLPARNIYNVQDPQSSGQMTRTMQESQSSSIQHQHRYVTYPQHSAALVPSRQLSNNNADYPLTSQQQSTTKATLGSKV